MTYLQVWRLLAKVAGVRGPVCRSGPLMRMTAGWIGDWRRIFSGSEPDVNSVSVRLSGQPHYFASDLAMKQLNYHIGPARTAAEAAWQWFVDHGYTKRSA